MDFEPEIISKGLSPNSDTSDLVLYGLYHHFYLSLSESINDRLDRIKPSLEKIPALKPDGTPRMLMKKGIGLVPYPPVLPTYSTSIEH